MMSVKETIEYDCPCCGSTLRFDAGTQQVICEYCGSAFDPLDHLMSEKDAELSSDSVNVANDGGNMMSDEDLADMGDFSCGTCGAQLYTEKTASATVCPFCGNSIILKGRMNGSLMPDRVIPFKKTKEQALEALERHCRKRFVTKGFIESNRLDEIKGVYVPYWVYSADLDADMTYTAVKERTILIGKNEDLVERKYYRVRRSGSISFDHVPADASCSMPDDLMESLEPFDNGGSVDFKTSYLSGYLANRYDVPQEDVKPIIERRMTTSADNLFKKTVQGYNDVYLSSSDIRPAASSVDYYLYPVWLFNLSWEEKRYVFAMNGQTGKVAGNLPLDKSKLLAVTIATFFLLILGMWAITGCDVRSDEIGDFLGWAIVISGLVSCCVYGYFSSMLNSVETRTDSDEYYREGSIQVDESSEEYLYKKLEMSR